MTANKSGSPLRSPKPPKLVVLDVPKTPPPAGLLRRMLAFLVTPEQPQHTLPFSPALKRTNLGSLKLPDYRLNTADGSSPYASSSVLKTPRNSGYNSDERETPRRTKLMRTPQYLSPGRRLFADEHSPNKQELLEISSQLKTRLSLALGKIKGSDRLVPPQRLDFGLSFTQARDAAQNGESDVISDVSGSANDPLRDLRLLPTLGTSPTLRTSPRLRNSPSRISPPSGLPPRSRDSLPRTNINLQTLQALPSVPRGPPVSIPSPDEESRAQNALLAAFSRNRRHLTSERVQLPPLNVALTQGEEQAAVYLLMSLASPQRGSAPLQLHLRLQSLGNTSPRSLRLLSVAVTLPPISGLMRDNDETDVESDTEED